MKNSSALSIKVFENPEFGEIRTCLIDGEPWFVGKDVATILGYENTRQAVSVNVKDKHRRVIQLSDLQEGLSDSLPANMKGSTIGLIDEAGFYSLIMRSTKPNAEAFQEWVTSEVLPSIRKTGTYCMKTDVNDVNWRVNFLFENVDRVKKLLNLGENDALMLLQRALPNTGAPLDLIPIPEYTNSLGVHKSATALLKEFGAKIKSMAFNILMEEKGFLVRKTRMSSKTPGKEKCFWLLTEEGLNYGINLVSPNNRSETQPHYYEKKFKELLDILGIITD